METFPRDGGYRTTTDATKFWIPWYPFSARWWLPTERRPKRPNLCPIGHISARCWLRTKRRRNDQALSTMVDILARWWTLTPRLDGCYGVLWRAKRTTLFDTFCCPWATFSASWWLSTEQRPKRRETMRTNGKRPRPPTPSHETVAVSPFSAITFQLRPWVHSGHHICLLGCLLLPIPLPVVGKPRGIW